VSYAERSEIASMTGDMLDRAKAFGDRILHAYSEEV